MPSYTNRSSAFISKRASEKGRKKTIIPAAFLLAYKPVASKSVRKISTGWEPATVNKVQFGDRLAALVASMPQSAPGIGGADCPDALEPMRNFGCGHANGVRLSHQLRPAVGRGTGTAAQWSSVGHCTVW